MTSAHILTSLNAAFDAALKAKENAVKDDAQTLALHRSFAETVQMRCENVRTACEAAIETRGDKVVFRAAGDDLGEGVRSVEDRIAGELTSPLPAKAGKGPDAVSAGLDACDYVRQCLKSPQVPADAPEK